MPTKPKKPTQKAELGDCVPKLQGLANQARLLVCDPPYNQKANYDAYKDNLKYDEYLDWSRRWLRAARDALTPDGSMWIFCPDEWVSELDIVCRKELKLRKQRHVVWAFTFGQKATKNFTRSHCHLLWMTKRKDDYVFNFDAVKVPSARQVKYNDKRAVAGGKPPDATWMLLKEQLEPHMGPDKDVWLVSRVCGTFKERKKHSPNQLPLPLLERIVLTCSDPGDLVVDPFAGTGGTGVVCAKHKRNWRGFDLSEECVKQSNARVSAK